MKTGTQYFNHENVIKFLSFSDGEVIKHLFYRTPQLWLLLCRFIDVQRQVTSYSIQKLSLAFLLKQLLPKLTNTQTPYIIITENTKSLQISWKMLHELRKSSEASPVFYGIAFQKEWLCCIKGKGVNVVLKVNVYFTINIPSESSKIFKNIGF